MKTKLSLSFGLITFFFCNSLIGTAQQTKSNDINKVVESRIEFFLTDGKLIKTLEEINKIYADDNEPPVPEKKKREKQNTYEKRIEKWEKDTRSKWQERIEALEAREFYFKEYGIPSSFATGFSVNEQTQLMEAKWNSLGSRVFPTKALTKKSSEIKSLDLLMVMEGYNQLNMPNHNPNNYQLNINYLNVVKKGMEVAASTKVKKYAEASADVAIKSAFSKNVNLNMAYGTFKNELAKTFQEVNDLTDLRDYKNFAPLFDLWKMNESKEIKGFIIDEIDGLLIYEERDNQFLKGNDVNTYAKLNLNVPFLNLSSSGSYNWKKSNEVGATSKTLDLYIKDVRFEEIPTPQRILKVWERISDNRSKSLRYKSGSSILIVDNYESDDIIVQADFGPVPNSQYIKNNLKAKVINDKNSMNGDFISSVEVINEEWEKSSNYGYWVDMKVLLNVSKIASSDDIEDEIIIKVPIELYYDVPVEINKKKAYLSQQFNLIARISTGPRIAYRYLEHKSEDNKDNWMLTFESTDEISDLKLVNIDFNIDGIEDYEEEIVNRHKSEKSNTLKKTWVINSNNSYFTPESGIDIPDVLQGDFSLSFSSETNSIPLLRKVHFYDFPITKKAVISKTNESKDVVNAKRIIRSEKSEVYAMLPENTVFDDGSSIKDLIDGKFSSEKEVFYLEELIEKGLIRKTEAGYEIIAGDSKGSEGSASQGG
ncbi:MAG: hypothetical protein RIM99_08260 [Cyclobacteriaceae bacterium]